jgi:hypothetical protein
MIDAKCVVYKKLQNEIEEKLLLQPLTHVRNTLTTQLVCNIFFSFFYPKKMYTFTLYMSYEI